MKIKTSEATPPQLNWMVAKCSGFDIYHNDLLKGVVMEGFWISGYFPGDLNSWLPLKRFEPSTNWSQGGPIIEREWERLVHWLYMKHGDNWASYMHTGGCTTLTAFMRCYVASKLGDEVEVPDELA